MVSSCIDARYTDLYCCGNVLMYYNGTLHQTLHVAGSHDKQHLPKAEGLLLAPLI